LVYRLAGLCAWLRAPLTRSSYALRSSSNSAAQQATPSLRNHAFRRISYSSCSYFPPEAPSGRSLGWYRSHTRYSSGAKLAMKLFRTSAGWTLPGHRISGSTRCRRINFISSLTRLAWTLDIPSQYGGSIGRDRLYQTIITTWPSLGHANPRSSAPIKDICRRKTLG